MALTCLPIHLYVLFANCDIFNRKEKKLEKARKKIERKYPNTTYRFQELATRRYLMRRKIITSAILLIGGTLLVVIAGSDFDKFEDWRGTVIALALLVGAYSVIFGVCNFAAAMHDPLTPQEAQELEENDRIEKGG